MYCLRPSGVPLRNGATWYSAGEVLTRHTLCVIGREQLRVLCRLHCWRFADCTKEWPYIFVVCQILEVIRGEWSKYYI